VIPAFEEFGDDVVLGFVVRYDPGELTRQATQLASRFGVANENTKIFAQFSQAALRRIEGFTEKEILKDRIRELWRS
jgi:hypothetical protein